LAPQLFSRGCAPAGMSHSQPMSFSKSCANKLIFVQSASLVISARRY